MEGEVQHRGHSGPRRLRRRGRESPRHGRRCSPARGRKRRPLATDPLRVAQGARATPAGRARGQQDRPPRCPTPRRSRTRFTSCSWTSTPMRNRSSSPSCTATRGRTGLARPGRGGNQTSSRCSRSSTTTSPLRPSRPDHPLQALITNLDARPTWAARSCRLSTAPSAAVSRRRGAGPMESWSGSRSRSCTCPRAGPHRRRPAAQADRAVAGLSNVTIGETLSDPDDPRPLPVLIVDEPSLGITIGINTSPLSGTEEQRSPPGCSRTASTPSSWATSPSAF